MLEKGYNWDIDIKNLHNVLSDVIKKGYGETIEFKFNGQLIPNFDILRFVLPTNDNLIKLLKYPIELKINGELYTFTNGDIPLKW
jgi:hypothetical protein